jgi:hypothetical protein
VAEVPSISDLQRYDLLRFGHDCLGLLALDELWTEAAKTNDESAPTLGREMRTLIERLMPRSDEVAVQLLTTASELNTYWPALRDFWGRTSEREIRRLDWWLRIEHEGLFGNAGVSAANELREGLAEELGLIQQQIATVETGAASDGDLSREKKILLGVVAACCLASVALPAIGGAVMAVGLAAGAFTGAANLAGVAAGFAGAAILGPPATAPTVSRAEQLEKLEALRDRGTLTQEEFAAEKSRLLGSVALPSKGRSKHWKI